jgi:hypothetical protein
MLQAPRRPALAPASTATSPSAPASTSAGTLTVSPATVDLGTGSAGQVTRTVGGSVNWLAGLLTDPVSRPASPKLAS